MDEAVNGARDDVVDELFTPALTAWVRDWFGSFRRPFPDMRMELVELVADGDTVVARFACSATHLGDWRGHAPTGRRFESTRSTSSASKAIASPASGGSRTRSSGSASSRCGRATGRRVPLA